MPKIAEFCEVVCNGQKYRDWTRVQINREFGAPASEFNLQVAEISASPSGWATLKLRPGDRVIINLAGEQVIAGYINARQAALNSNAHAVMLKGLSKTQDAVASSHIVKGGQYRGYNFEQLASAVVKPFGLKFLMKNPPPDAGRPFDDVQVYHGETAFEFLERLARQRGIFLHDDPDGNLVGGIVDEKAASVTLEEGRNIYSISAIIRDDTIFSTIRADAQQKGSDDLWGADAAQISATSVNTSVSRYRPLLIVAEEPSSQKDVQDRADREQSARIGTSVSVQVVVQGWLRPDTGKLWNVGVPVSVKSPSVFPNTGGLQNLAIKGVTFSQGPELPGTITVLDLVLPEGLGKPFGGLVKEGDGSDLFKPGVKPAEPTPPSFEGWT
jgi:prophage tail gpP-like protein